MSDFNGESIRKAYESRRSAVEALRAFDAGIGERALTAEEVATIGVMNADVDALDETVQRLMRDQELSERSATLDALIGAQHDAGERSEVDSLTPIEREARQLFLGRDHDEARSTAEFSAPSSEIARLARRDLTAGTASAGGNLVPTTLFGELYSSLRENADSMFSLARDVVTTGGEQMGFPTVTTFSAAALIAEAGAVGESDPAFGLVNLDAYKYGMSIQISTELEEDNAVPGMLPWILEQAVSGIRRGVGAHLVTGTGSGQPNGIDNGTTISSIAVSTTPTADQLVAIQHDIASPYRQNASWLFNDATVSAIRLLKDTTNQYIWAPGLGAGVSDTLLGAPVYTDAAVETAGVSKKVGIYGDIKAGYLVRTVANIRAERSVDYAFLNDLNTWRFLSRHDGDIIDNSAFTVIKNAAS
jgi:HK97 family phage major capsid protein